MEAVAPMLLEARDDTATRQGDGPTEYDGTVQPATVGMEVERPTDGAVGEGRDVAGTTTTGSTDMTATSVGVVGMAVEGATEGAPGRAGGRGREAETGTTAVRVAGTRRYHAGALEGMTRGERRKLAKAKKKAAR